MLCQSSEVVLYYWPVKARNVLSLLIAHHGKIAITQTTPDWPAFKPHTVFGQLPHLSFNGLQISQVWAGGPAGVWLERTTLCRVTCG